VNHPAHVHLLRHAVEEWRRRGHECLVTARDKDVAVQLLEAYRLPYEVLSVPRRGQLGRALELLEREARFLRVARRFRPHVITGTSPHAGRVGRLVGARSAVLNEDDAAVVPLFRWVSYPLATAIVTPDCLAHERHGPAHLTYPSYQELFYLHPNRFGRDPSVREEIGLAPGERFAVVRLSALDAHHDRGIRGVSADLLAAVRRLAGDVKLLVSGEKAVPAELAPIRLRARPERMHHVLAEAEFFVGDSQTMTAESAVLGVPAFRINDFVGRISYLAQLESYGLAFGFRPGQESALLERLGEVLAMPGRREEFSRRRERLLADKTDPLPWFLETIEALARGRRPAAA
jgi:predicted glycosyltransferase